MAHFHTFREPDPFATIEVRPSPVERLARYLLTQLAAWLGPKLQRMASFLFEEFRRGLLAAALLGFALVAAVYGAFYLIDLAIVALDMWLPHWASLSIIAGALLLPALIAATLGVWQLSRMKLVRGTVAGLAQVGVLLWSLTRPMPAEAEAERRVP
ncbi:hypothetical protein HLB23_13935 [Nocardia uniformis]|uniref:Phage holin family protein n=1 Tax=Nocardia uniformis TaxID=53432 RepID=A0A849C027_9NOCA|nr:phage holin family protein [Nocardia uniformis]NNH70948.1 hypothetical protein [Nocardia uniformis]